MVLKTLKDIDLKGKTVLYRVAYDIGPVEEGGELVVKNTARITATLPTLEYLINQGCKIVMLTWVKRPGGQVVEKLRTTPHARALEQALGRPVRYMDDCVGPAVEAAVDSLKAGELLMLENTRFHPEEESADQDFARALAKGKDAVVFDAFGHAHRVHASTTGILQELPSVAGMLMDKEFSAYEKILEAPQRPIVAILGGAKISDKLDTMQYLLESRVDLLLVGGALANVFLKGFGNPVGTSLVEVRAVDKGQQQLDYPDLAKKLYQKAPAVDPSVGWPIEARKKLVLPVDLMGASALSPDAETKIFHVDDHDDIPATWQYLDIGPQTAKMYADIVSLAKTVFWNGPMGYFELEKFGTGTRAVAEAVAHSSAFSIVAGGDTETVIEKYNLQGRFDHVSTGGGVSLKILAGKELPVLRYLKK